MRIPVALVTAWMVVSPRSIQQPARVASLLDEGMQLVYVSDGRTQAPWTVDSVRVGLPLRDGSDCATLSLRRGPQDPRPERSRLCLAADTLYRWDSKRNGWSVFRPVGPDMNLTVVRPNGDSVHYATGPLGEDVVSGTAVQVVSTTVTTVDAQGRSRLRVRERYAVTLATATSGTFEVPDPTNRGSWVPQHTFTLKEMRSPR
jgi:hypothetical protein